MFEKIIIFILLLIILVFILQLINDLQKIYYRFKNMKKWKEYKGKYVLIRIERDDNGNYKELLYVTHLSKHRFSSRNDISQALIFDNQKEAFNMLKKYDWDMSILKL